MVNKIGLMIGGTPGPDDIVGMHIAMPTGPGVGVKVTVGDANKALEMTATQIPENDLKTEKLKQIINDAISEQDPQSKFQKIKDLIAFGADITQLAGGLSFLKSLLGL